MQLETSDKLNDGLPASHYHRAVLRAESCGTVRASREAWQIPVGSQTSAHGRAPMLLVMPVSGLGRRFNPALKPSVFGPRGVRLGELEREFMSRSVPAVAELVPRDVADVLAARLVRVPLAGAAVQAWAAEVREPAILHQTMTDCPSSKLYSLYRLRRQVAWSFSVPLCLGSVASIRSRAAIFSACVCAPLYSRSASRSRE